MPDHPSSTWEAMQDGEVFYRKQQLYSISGKIIPNLSDCRAAGCLYGGPIALMRDTTKLIAIGGSAPSFSKSQVQIYSPAGDGLLLFSWDQGKIIKFGWTGDERLVMLNEEGVYRVYDLQGDFVQHSLGTEAAESGVVDAKIHKDGLVAITGNLSLLEVQGWTGSKPMTLANPGLAAPPTAWAVIPPDLGISRHVEVLMSIDVTVFTLDNLECTDQRLSRGPFTHVSPSPNGKLLALVTFNGTLWVVSSDFQRSITEYDTSTAPAEGAIQQVEWCGNDAIIVVWENHVVLVGPYSDALHFPYKSSPFAVAERDGIRIMTQDVSDFIQKVPTASLSIFRPGSTSPAAILYDAWESFSHRSPKADESIRSIKPDLVKAVDQCIAAAGYEWEPHWQRRLLNAAKFGRGYLDRYDPTDFVKMGQVLKVLNAVRFYEVGIPMSYDQYRQATPSHLISRLTARNLHLLALRISTYLGLRPDVVLKHWASAKIMKSKPSTLGDSDASADDEICKLIVDKFEQLGGADFSYADIAKRAWEVGRTGLATKLLDYELRASDQVPLLLEMKEDRLALAKAVDSGDTDLVYQVLLHLHKRLPLGSFFRLIEDGGPKLAPASRLLEVYAREQNREMLRDFYYSDDRRVESAVLCLEEAATYTDPEALASAIKSARKFFSEDKDHGFEAKMMDEYSKLLDFQQDVEKEAEGRCTFQGLSVHETISQCLTNGMSKRADKAKSIFAVPDKRFWYLKLHALTNIRDWDGLEAFAKSKKSPIGYEPFVRYLLKKGHPKQASSFVARCDAAKRPDLFVECGEWRAAAVECKERGNKAKLEELRQQAPNTIIQRELDQIASTMK